MHHIVILDEDKHWARQRVAELEAAIAALGPEFHEAFNQSSETWHDNAPFESVRDQQAVYEAERQYLRGLLQRSLTSVPKQPKHTVGIGAVVTLQTKTGQLRQLKIAGDWTPDAGKTKQDVLVVSRAAPIAQAVLGKRTGESTIYGTLKYMEYV